MRIVVNDSNIYECPEKQPIVITGMRPVTKLVVTNGFHSSRILHIKFQPGQYLYEVESYIDNVQLATGLMLALLFFLIYIFSGIRFFLFFANVPLLMMVYVLYGKRHDFIQVHKLKPGKKTSGVS